VRKLPPAPPVVFEDASLVAFDKPSGEWLPPKERGLTLVHRPDPAASGLLVFAKTKRALDFLSGQFQSKSVEQVYHAFCVALPETAVGVGGPDVLGGESTAFEVDWWIGQDRESAAGSGRMKAFRRNGGQPALSAFRVLERFGRSIFMECRPQSNRRHQLRVHLAAVGLPVLNDPVYGRAEERLLLSSFKRNYKGGVRAGAGGAGGAGGAAAERALIEQLALHASSLTLRHPESGEPLTLTAPLPKAFEVALRNLRKFAPRSGGGPTGPRRLGRAGM